MNYRQYAIGAALGLVYASPALGALPGDPFQPGLRWIWQAPAANPWIPGDVSFGAGDQLVWASAKGARAEYFALDSAGSGARSPHFRRSLDVASSSSVAVAAAGGDRLFALWQAEHLGVDKRTTVERFDALSASTATGFDPRWTERSALITRGPARLTSDRSGDLVVAASFDPGAGRIEISWYDGASGALTQRTNVAGGGLEDLVVSADGSRVALAAGSDVYVFDEFGLPVDHLVRPTSKTAIALSATGRALVLGGDRKVDVYGAIGAGYRLMTTLQGQPVEQAARLALSDDAGVLAIGWWDRTTGVDVRLEVHDLRTPALLLEHAQTGQVGGLQNFPGALAITPDGSRVALGTWGYADTEPEVLVFDKDNDQPQLAIDLPGSVFDLALDSSGTRVAVAHKDTHANAFGATGAVRLYDTGERDVQQVEPAALGGTLEVAAARPGARRALFLVGDRAPRPQVFPGIGTLALSRATIRAFVRTSDATGRADWSRSIPNDAIWIGTPWSVQVLFRSGGSSSLSETTLDPLILAP